MRDVGRGWSCRSLESLRSEWRWRSFCGGTPPAESGLAVGGVEVAGVGSGVRRSDGAGTIRARIRPCGRHHLWRRRSPPAVGTSGSMLDERHCVRRGRVRRTHVSRSGTHCEVADTSCSGERIVDVWRRRAQQPRRMPAASRPGLDRRGQGPPSGGRSPTPRRLVGLAPRRRGGRLDARTTSTMDSIHGRHVDQRLAEGG